MLPSLVICLIAAGVTGWVMTEIVGSDTLTSIWVSALLATVAAIVIRLIIGAFVFND